MTHSPRTSLLAFSLVLFGSLNASAQSGRKPNVLFVIDTSGSMEYETGADTYPTCDPSGTTSEKSRWIKVLEVLTGTISNYSCAAEDRSDPGFLTEFKMPGVSVDPPDAYYRNPYHRPLSSGCAITPFELTPTPLTNAFDWDPPSEAAWPVSTSAPAACTTAFNQQPNGFIDTYTDVARFGLMTFDPLPDPGPGHAGGPGFGPNYSGGVLGGWSYYSDSSPMSGGPRPAEGKPAGCPTYEDLEVGVRNGAAPASEGKMIYFGDQDLNSALDNARHNRIKQVLLSTRPYGATPINGALDDARAFLWYEDDLEPTGQTGGTLYGSASTYLSPAYDEYVSCGCREQHVILITDGEPNLDLRPECDAANTTGDTTLDGVCPYQETSEEILADLSGKGTTPLACAPVNPNNQYQILTHVIGFSTATYGGGANLCRDLPTVHSDWDTGICTTTGDEDLKVCCTLHYLAKAGGTGTPHIAPDSNELQTALGDIMASIVPRSASGTQPVRSPGVGRGEGAMAAFRLLTSYETVVAGGENVWRGNVERLRWVCAGGAPVAQARDLEDGDDFGHNIAKNIGSRTFLTYEETGFNSEGTIRPFLPSTVSDGLGTPTSGNVISGNLSTLLGIDPAAMSLALTDPACTGLSTTDACRDRILNWMLGSGDDLGNSRCPSIGDEESCSVIGDVFHSTPTIVDRPTAAVEDETYDAFAVANQSRWMAAYVSSNDGVLHGFKVSSNDPSAPSVDDGIHNDLANNELFAFLPPAVLPLLKDQHPTTRLQLLDGQAVTMDVVATSVMGGYLFERTAGAADGATNTWRTVMVQAFGGSQPGYFALDVTDPTAPTFLWQITKTAAGNDLFGLRGTPLITTVSMKTDPLDAAPTEVAVAVLPGGTGDSPLGTSCARTNGTIGGTNAFTHFDSTITAGYSIRANVGCYADTPTFRAARSLTIVRLDSGEVIRRFTYEPDVTAGKTPDTDLGTLAAGPFSNSQTPYLDSPISGAPAAYPAGPGMIADRVFVGDQEGTLWRVDLSEDDPGDWTMQLFFDAYTGQGATEGEPIEVAPALSINDFGQITVAFGTGVQEAGGAVGDKQYVWSLTEVEGSADYAAKVNWKEVVSDGSTGASGQGEHLLGPISLLSGVLYFTTVLPPAASVCNSPRSRIWGLDYTKPADDSNLALGGLGALAVDGEPVARNGFADALTEDQDIGVIYGVSPEFVPSCVDTSTGSDDDYLGNSRTSVTSPSSSNLQLVFQTATTEGEGADLNFRTGFHALGLEAPRTASTILSWAAILE